MIIKVYVENDDQEVNITTLNCDDKKCTSVTITSAYINECLSKVSYRIIIIGIVCVFNFVNYVFHFSSDQNPEKLSRRFTQSEESNKFY